ncbi:hypothetical protein [Clostridium sp. B9]|uniref:hypothetical protein n=1 Tax=Clostridium sp. B9 TaxID=3423224 RepID=UPI003D2F0992
MFNSIWCRIILNERNTFSRRNGIEFRYHVSKNKVIVEGENHALSKEDFLKVYNLMKELTFSEIESMVVGTKYIWPILNDKRIKEY